MKKKSFGLVLLISVLVIVIVFYSFVTSVLNKNDGDDSGEGNGQIVFIDKQDSDVVKLTFSSSGSSFTIVKTGGTYALEEDEEFPLNLSAVAFMTNAAAHVTFERRIRPEGGDLSDYGLETNYSTLEAHYSDGARLVMKIGNYNEYADAYYCGIGNDVYLLNSAFAEAFEYTVTDLLQDDTVEMPQKGFDCVTSIEITDKNGTAVLKPSDDGEGWIKVLPSGKTEVGNYYNDAQDIYNELFKLQVDEWAAYNAESDENRAPYGLAQPELKILFNHIESVDISSEGSSVITKEYARTTTFIFGTVIDKDLGEDEGQYRYFMFGDGSVVYVVSESDLPVLFSGAET